MRMGEVCSDGGVDRGSPGRVSDVDAAVLSAVDPDACRAVFDGDGHTRTCEYGGSHVEARLQPVTDDGDVTAGMVVAAPAR